MALESNVAPPVPIEWPRGGSDQVVMLRGLSWEQYVAISDARGEQPRPLFAYLDGDLEIVTTSDRHEIIKTLVARLIEAYAEERDISLNGVGMATMRREERAAGAEPDESYWIGAKHDTRDLAIEIVHTHGGVRKLEIYRRLGVREVWFWINGRFWIYWLDDDRYTEQPESRALPGIDLREVERIVASTDDDRQMQAVRAYRHSLSRGA